jgi:hypothetical protein
VVEYGYWLWDDSIRMKVNLVYTSKPGDGLLFYSYEHSSYLNSLGIQSQLVIVTHPAHTKDEYVNIIKDKYISFQNIIFNEYNPTAKEITLIMGRSMLTWAYLYKKYYEVNQLLTLNSLFKNKLISVYSENHPNEYNEALNYFKPKKVFDLCDFDVYPNGVGKQFEKIINFSIYKPIKNDVQFKYLFLGTNKKYYESVKKNIKDYNSYSILAYNEDYIDKSNNHIFVPVKNILGIFDTYVYTKDYFDPAPRLMQECRYFKKGFIYLRDKSIKDGGSVYYNRQPTCLTDKANKKNIDTLVLEIIND